MQSAIAKIPAWSLVLCSTLIGFALSLKNAAGTPNTGDAVILVSLCTGVGIVFGCVLELVLCRVPRLSDPGPK